MAGIIKVAITAVKDGLTEQRKFCELLAFDVILTAVVLAVLNVLNEPSVNLIGLAPSCGTDLDFGHGVTVWIGVDELVCPDEIYDPANGVILLVPVAASIKVTPKPKKPSVKK